MVSGLHDTHTRGLCTCLHIFMRKVPENCFPIFCTCLIVFRIVVMIRTFVCLDAQWYSREDVRKALTFAEYKKTQRTAAAKVHKLCKGVEKGRSSLARSIGESGKRAPMFVPGPFAIAHHLISAWANQDLCTGVEAQLTQPRSFISKL